jgi:hypothetical protein
MSGVAIVQYCRTHAAATRHLKRQERFMKILDENGVKIGCTVYKWKAFRDSLGRVGVALCGSRPPLNSLVADLFPRYHAPCPVPPPPPLFTCQTKTDGGLLKLHAVANIDMKGEKGTQQSE